MKLHVLFCLFMLVLFGSQLYAGATIILVSGVAYLLSTMSNQILRRQHQNLKVTQ